MRSFIKSATEWIIAILQLAAIPAAVIGFIAITSPFVKLEPDIDDDMTLEGFNNRVEEGRDDEWSSARNH